ncbi:MAG TPA: efflux RND transporter permease subunit [Longimicrobiales bacterium]|nr:efflux RND transporter permease subunit [Longimicrobiales bacterium]
MIRFFARLAVTRPVLTTMIVLSLVILGAFSYLRLGVDLIPGIDFPVVTVMTVYPGAGPEEVENEVTEPIEDAVSTIANLESLTSFSQDNVSIIIIEFGYGVDADLAAIDVKDKVDAIRAGLPGDVQPSTIQKLDITAMPIMELALSGPQSLATLYDIADKTLRDRLSQVEGVASVSVTGGREREVEVRVHPDRLRAYGLAINDVAALVGAGSLTVPAGRITQPDAEYAVRVTGEYASVQEIEALPVPLPSGGRVRLGDLATVVAGFEDQRELARFNGQPTVSLSLQKRSDGNTVAAAAGVFEVLDELRAQLPPGAELRVARDYSQFIRDAIRDTVVSIIIGIGLTTLVLFLFLHSWRGTVVAAVAMPATIVATFLAIDQLGFTINVMTLMGLGITVGILVTNTIIVLESIYRHLDQGADPRTAAEEGTTEVGVAVLASALTNVVVFTPIAFMQGIIGQFFYAFGLTVLFATVISVLISFTLAPMLAAKLLRTHETEREETEGRLSFLWKRFDRGYDAIEAGYRKTLSWILERPRNSWAVVGATAAIVLVAGFIQFAFVGGEFMPAQDEGVLDVTLELPPGTPIGRTAAVAERAERLLQQIPEVTDILLTIGGSGSSMFGAGGDVNQASLTVTLESELPTESYLPRIRELLASIPDAGVGVTLGQSMGGGAGDAPLQVLVKGPDQARLEELAQRATEVVNAVPGLVEVQNTIEDPRPEVMLHPRREVLTEYGLTVAQVGGALRSSIEGATAGVFREAGEERDIRVRLAETSRNRVDELGDLQIRTRAGMVPTGTLGELGLEGGESMILRDQKQRTVRIDAQIGSGSLTQLAAEIQTGLDAMGFPPGYSYEITGEFEIFQESLTEMGKALILAVILTYVVLAMIMESYVHPITIMITLPLGAVGSTFAFFLTGNRLNVFSMMALIMLVGIVVNNAILILDYTQILRERGMSLHDALLEAASARLRPIIMTNVATAIALVPQALATGSGAFFQVSMAVVTIGGVLGGAVFTVFLIPVIYVALDRFTAAGHGEVKLAHEGGHAGA